jgi:subtilisin family serine protease
MKRLLATSLAALTLVACSGSPTGPAGSGSPEELATPDAPYYAKPGTGIAGEYIVVFRSGVSAPLATVEAKLLRLGGTRRFSYAGALTGFAAALPPGAIALLRADPDVAFIEQDGLVQASAIQSNAPWALDRIDQRTVPLSGRYTYHASGAGVTAYVIDTGIETAHPQFGGRATVAYDGVGDGRDGQDCNGHGTHIAGIIGSATYGVAKGVALRAVRVLDCTGAGRTSAVIAGMNWVAAHHVPMSVANVSLGGGYSAAANAAANNLANSGVFLAVSAGNTATDACNQSPASAANVTTVAASTSTDSRASYSNYGSCVDLYAPGSSITSTWINGGTNTLSGTSMATPVVTGVAALYKATLGDGSYSTVRTWLKDNATTGVITGNVAGTPNRLLFKVGL